ncbi:MAG: hypothetical protein JJU00_19205 [Opitutales bacterium]|nr:hypothetical protein [Opitutales bacterium]
MWRNLFNIFKQDNLFTQALKESHEMLDLDLRMIEASVESLRRSDDGSISIDILGMDKRINRFERDVRQKVLTHLAVSGPGDLSSGMVLVSIIIDIERIGDYAKNIHDLARLHPSRLTGGAVEEDLARVEAQTLELFRDTVQAFRENDVEMARRVMVGYKEGLSAASEGIVAAIVEARAGDLDPGTSAAVALYARYLKRIGGHSRNIVTSVVNPFHRLGYKEKKPKKLK